MRPAVAGYLGLTFNGREHVGPGISVVRMPAAISKLGDETELTHGERVSPTICPLAEKQRYID